MVRTVLRTKSVTTKVTEAEYARLEALAEAAGVNMSEWMRGKLLGTERSDCETEVLLGEVLALRTILMNLLFSIARGEAVTPEQMQALIARADGDKSRRAMERLTAARATGPEQESEAASEVATGTNPEEG